MNNLVTQIKKMNLGVVGLFIVVSPFIDLFTSLMVRKFSFAINIGIVIRSVFLLLMILWLIFKNDSKYKKQSLFYILLVFCLCFLFIGNALILKDLQYFFSEIKSIIKFMYFPIISVCFVNYFSSYDKKNNIKTVLLFINVIYMFLLFVPWISNSGFLSYRGLKQGIVGWFYSPNEISAILAIISPFIVFILLNKKNSWYWYLLLLIYIFLIMQVGTKAPVLGMFISLFMALLICLVNACLFKKKSYHKKIAITIVYVVIALILTFKTNISSNILLQSASYQEQPQNLIDINNEELVKILLNKNYSFPKTKALIPDKVYKDSRLLNLIFSSRNIYLQKNFAYFKESSLYEKTFGMGYNIMNSNGATNIVELDVFDVLFNYGVVGFIIYFLPLLYFVIKIFVAFFKNFKKYMSNDNQLIYLTALIISLLISFLAGHVMGAPAVSIYSSLTLGICGNVFVKKDKMLKKNKIIISKKIVAATIAITIALTFLTGAYNFCFNKQTIENIKLSIIDNEFKTTKQGEWVLKEKEQREFSNIKDYLYYYEYYVDNNIYIDFIYVKRIFPNDTTIEFITVNNLTNKNIDLTIELGKDTISSKYFNFKEYEVEKAYDSVIGYDKTTLPIEYQENEDGSVLIGKTYQYSNRLLNYSDGSSSRIKDLIREVDDKIVSDGKAIKEIEISSKSSIDTYIIKSSANLFADDESIMLYIDYVNNRYTETWLSYDGSYAKVPYSIEPSTANGYAHNLNKLCEMDVFTLSDLNDSIIFDSLYLTTIQSLYEYIPRHILGVWFTEYTSTWLKNDYGITSFYVDTRHNEKLAYYLELIGKKLNDETITKSFFNYADYLVSEYNSQNLLRFKDGILFPDYFSINQTSKTHASLNHQLAIVNYLLDSYIEIGNKEYYNIASELIDTISKQGEKWINKDNGDLWYQINSNETYQSKDYLTLTLTDLLKTQKLLIKVNGKKNEMFTKLIDSKLKYLVSVDCDISQFDLKNY